MITTLTDEQKALMPVYRDRWLDIGLAAGDYDKRASEAAIRKVYTCAGLEPPSVIIHTDSPLHNGVLYAIIKDKSVRASVRASVWASVRESVWASVGASVRESVWANVGASVGASVWDSVGDSVWASVGDSVRDSVRDSVGDSCYAGHDAGWLSFYNFFHEVVGIDLSRLNGLWDAAKHCGWFIPLEKVCIVSRKPLAVRTRADRRGVKVIHAEGQPAIDYGHDFQIWAYDGVRLTNPRYHSHPNQWEAKWLLEEKNAELRRVLIQALGAGRIFSELGGKVLDSWQSSQQGVYELVKLEQSIDVEPYVMVKMTCPSTGLLHAHRVPPAMTSAREAISWINNGVDPETFAKVA
jgi:hypothetical protein